MKRVADSASDHHLVVAVVKTKLKAYKDQAGKPAHKFNVHNLKEKTKVEEYRTELRNKFSLLSLLQEETIEEQWVSVHETWKTTCETVLGKKTRKHKEWLTTETWILITERKKLKDMINQTHDQTVKKELQTRYQEKNKEVKRSARRDKRKYTEELTTEAETAAGQRIMKRLYDITRTLSGKNNKPSCPVKDKSGNTIANEKRRRERDGQNILRKLLTDQRLPFHLTSLHQPTY